MSSRVTLSRRLGAVLGRGDAKADENGSGALDKARKCGKPGTGLGYAKRGPFADLTNGHGQAQRAEKEREEREREEERKEERKRELEKEKLGLERDRLEAERVKERKKEELRLELVREERAALSAKEEREKAQKAKEEREKAQQVAKRHVAKEDWVAALDPVDQAVVTDPLWVAEYAGDIFERLRQQEMESVRPAPDYMLRQDHISDKMRAILVDWLVEVNLKFKLTSDTLFLTVGLLDRYLSKRTVQRNQLQLVGVTCLLLAAKYEEVYAPEVRDIVGITDRAYKRSEIMDMEVQLLTALQFRLTLCSPLLFLRRFARLLQCDKQIELLAQYILELSLVDYRMLKYAPSHLSSASLLLANKVMKKSPAWPPHLIRATHNKEESLRACAKEMCALLQGAEKSSLQAVRKKFSSEKYAGVAKLLSA